MIDISSMGQFLIQILAEPLSLLSHCHHGLPFGHNRRLK
jgi:hypothetical protein